MQGLQGRKHSAQHEQTTLPFVSVEKEVLFTVSVHGCAQGQLWEARGLGLPCILRGLQASGQPLPQ